MKFGKEFSSQMVPEWHEAYMDYHKLKIIIKDIQRFKRENKSSSSSATSAASKGGIMRNMTLYRAFSGLTSSRQHSSPIISPHTLDLENPVIVVNKHDSASYETKFLMSNDDGAEYETVYFRRLDDEFNKVDKFYKGKVDEVVKEAELLNRQMDAWIAFRMKVENPDGWFDRTAEINRLASDIAGSAAVLSASTPHGAKSKRRAPMDAIEEDDVQSGPNNADFEQSDDTTNDDEIEMETIHKQVEAEKSARIRPKARPAPLEVLNRVQFNNTLETPRSTIKSFLKVPNHTELKFSRHNLRRVEQQLKRAFVEFYQKLRLLKSYSFLNVLAFSKIMKKYDKVSLRNASKPYLNMVDNSTIGNSDEVVKLMERVEATFIKHFSNSNRSKGMNILRPKAKRARHRETFSLGFFAGCSAALVLALILIVRAQHLLDKPGRAQYMETLFPLYSLFAFIVLHMILYAANIFFWRKYRVNYAFIFGFKQGTELGYREVLLAAFGLGVLALGSVILNLDMEMDPSTQDYQSVTELLPLGVVILVIVILICPFNIIYRSSRYFFMTCLFHCILAPLYKVTLPDFFLADQLTSQVQALRSFLFYICYYSSGDYKHRDSFCKENSVYRTFLFIVAVIPYTFRFLQCLRRLYEEKDAMQGYNGLKYFSTIVAVCMRTAYSLNKSPAWNIIAWISSAIAAIVSLYWDLVLDWGLLQKGSKNRWLRDKLLVPHKKVYYIAMILNVLLRFAWMQTVLNFKFDFLHRETLITIMASLEIIRRGIWNFFRLENEHLNNVGKYRAFKSVPLPFNYADEEEKEE